MWMTEFVKEVKKQLRDTYGLTPSRMVGDEPCFDEVPDGIYPMTIEGQTDPVTCIVGGKFTFLHMKIPKEKT